LRRSMHAFSAPLRNIFEKAPTLALAIAANARAPQSLYPPFKG
jgi:hypothetical protein